MELRDFIEIFIQKSAEQPRSLRDYVYNFTTYSAKAIVVGNLLDLERGR